MDLWTGNWGWIGYAVLVSNSLTCPVTVWLLAPVGWATDESALSLGWRLILRQAHHHPGDHRRQKPKCKWTFVCVTSANIPLEKGHTAGCRERKRSLEVMAKCMTPRSGEEGAIDGITLPHPQSTSFSSSFFLLLAWRNRAHLIRNVAWFPIGEAWTMFSFIFFLIHMQ